MSGKVVEKRKASHIEVCTRRNVQARSVRTHFDEIHLIHNALPEINLGDVQLGTKLLQYELKAPLLIEAMSGGTPEAAKLNAILAEAAESFGIGMGVGSQRAAIEDPSLEYTYRVVREKAPTSFLIANLGAPQLARGYGAKEAEKALEMISANALAIHLNPLQEVIQIEGEPEFRNCLSAIHDLASLLGVPIIAKEIGAGISKEVSKAVEKAGVRCIDIGGAGGTSWAAVEYYRADKVYNAVQKRLGLSFWDWGIPTALSLIEVKSSTGLSAIASGGVRNGLEVAKAIALGADAVGIALPFLRYSLEGRDKLMKEIDFILQELKTAMFLVGAKTIDDLKKVPVAITGTAAEYLRFRQIDVESYKRRP
jgi:isopentenyl-diphosphate Delta-isomerase